jgi:hypothetical protein
MHCAVSHHGTMQARGSGKMPHITRGRRRAIEHVAAAPTAAGAFGGSASLWSTGRSRGRLWQGKRPPVEGRSPG